MSSKLSNTSKNAVITAVIILAALLFKSFFSLSKMAVFQLTSLPYLLICCIPLAIFIFSKLSPECGKDFKAVDIIALIGIAYTFFVVLDDSVIRNPVMITLGILSIALVLSQNIYTLIAAAGLCIVAAFSSTFGQAGPICASSVICSSMVRFSYLYQKQKKTSAKKAKKASSEVTAPDYKKEKALFVISEAILFVALAVSTYYRKNTIALITFMSNIEYIIPAFVVAVALFALAVAAVKNKRAFIEVIGYAIAIVAMPLSLLSEYSVAALGVAGALFLMLSLCDGKAMLPAGVYAENIFCKISESTKKNSKTAEE